MRLFDCVTHYEHAMPEANERICWQCGALADPHCTFTQNLVIRSSKKADGLGFPVRRGLRGSDVVKVAIPRCEACRERNYIWAFLLGAGAFLGAVVGGLTFPSKGWTTILGAVIGGVPGALVVLYHRRRYGLRSTGTYPPLLQLRKAGWEDPN